MIRHSLGIFIDGEVLRLALLCRGFRRIKWTESLSIEKFREKTPAELQKHFSAFLKRNQASNCRSVLVIPKNEVIVRQIELPIEAESNLAKVVEYQVASLLPSEEASVAYDFFVSNKKPDAKTFEVTVFLILKARLQHALNVCGEIGLKVDRVIPSNVVLANYFILLPQQFQAPAAALVHITEHQAEIVSFVDRSFHQSRSFQFSSDDDLWESLKAELRAFREQAQVAESALLDVFLVGHAENAVDGSAAEEHLKIHRILRPAAAGLELASEKLDGLRLSDYFPAMAAALSGLEKKDSIPVNLLPPEARPQKSRWAWASAYALLAANLALLACLALRGTVQGHLYARQLAREISRLEPEVKKVRSVESQLADLQRRSALLSNFRKSNGTVLGALNELSVVLPRNSYVQQFNIKDRIIEINGASDEAATLPKLLDNSPYFKNAEFTAPITRDGSGKEQYRIKMQLEDAPRLSPAPGSVGATAAQNSAAPASPNR